MPSTVVAFAAGAVTIHTITLTEIDSTNAEALRLIAAGDVVGWACVSAERQTAGRGRQGRAWASPPGNLHASFVVPKDARAEWARPWLLGFSVALAVIDALAPSLAEPAPLRLKWPNDVLIGGAKAAGLLLEGAGRAPFVVAGVGVNVQSSPHDTPYPATHLAAHAAHAATAVDVLGRLKDALPRRVERWLDLGFSAVRRDLLERMHAPGERLRVRDENGGFVEGRFADIAEDGRLVLLTAQGERRFSTGDVYPTLVTG